MLKTLDNPLSYIYFDGEKKDAQLVVTGFESAVSKMASIPEYLKKHKSDRMIINFPNAAANFDIVIIDGSGDSHGIQVTTQTKAKKCSSSRRFYESTDCKFKYILTSEQDDFTLDAKNAFIEGFKVHELRVIKARQLLSESDLREFRPRASRA